MSWWPMRRRRGSREAQLDAELRFHIERHVQDLVDAGCPPAEARRRARLELGDLDLAKAECREVRPGRWLAHVARDARLGVRALRREPRFAAAVIGVLSPGVAAGVVMFSVLEAIVLRPLPYARPAELVTLSTYDLTHNQWDGTSPPNMRDWRAQAATFADMSGYRRTQVSQVTLRTAGESWRLQEGLVDEGFFDLLGTPPLLGRTFARADFDAAEPVVVLAEGLWREQFDGSPAVLGGTILVDGRGHVVIGVMPERFQLPTSGTRLWRPLSVLGRWWRAAAAVRDGDGIEVIGRLRPGVRLETAQSEMAVVAARLRAAHAENRNRDVRVTALFDHVVEPRTRRGVWLGFAAVLLLLAAACANAGGLLAARAARRRREMAVRSALGAPRWRLVSQLLGESLTLWAVASAFGLLLASGSIRLLLAYGPRALPRMEQVGLDAAAVAVAFLGGLAVMLVAGTAPALLAARARGVAAFGSRNAANAGGTRLQDSFVVGQIACAVFLLVVAVLFARSFFRAQGEDPGFAARHLLVVRIERPAVPWFFREARERVGRLPGVTAVGGIKQFFLRRNPDQRVTIEGSGVPAGDAPRLTVDAVIPGYFQSMDIEVIDGRDFDDHDLEPGARVSIVNETMARRFWPGERAVGKRWTGGTAPPRDGRWDTIVGVVRDMRREGLDIAPIASAFVPDTLSGNFDLTVRASTDVRTLSAAVRAEIRAIDGALPMPEIAWADGSLSARLGGRRFEAQLLVVFTALAVVLSAVGLYAALAFQVASRTRELGIRAALGGTRRSIVGLIVGRGLRLALAGSVLGVSAAAVAATGLQALLYETAAVSAGSYAAAVTFVLLVAAAAAWVPAWRAASISPIAALHDD